MAYDFGFAMQAPVSIHEPWEEVVVVVEVEEGRRRRSGCGEGTGLEAFGCYIKW